MVVANARKTTRYSNFGLKTPVRAEKSARWIVTTVRMQAVMKRNAEDAGVVRSWSQRAKFMMEGVRRTAIPRVTRQSLSMSSAMLG